MTPDREIIEQPAPRRVRLPGFVGTRDIGLGDAVSILTASIGLRHCGGCEQRAQALNRRIVFHGGRNESGS